MTKAPAHDAPLAKAVGQFVLETCTIEPVARESFPRSELWEAVTRTGTELWLDTGDVDAARELWTQEYRALTTNNTLLNKEVQKGIYDELVPDAAAVVRDSADGDVGPDVVVPEIAFVLNACHGLHLVNSFDADVSVELHTDLADDAEGSYRYGKRFAALSPDRFIVKVPLTPAGLVAARRLTDDGIRVNFTLGFSARQNVLIATVARATWVNVFMGRINAFLADNGFGDGVNAGEKATLASQRALRERRLASNQIGASIRNGQQCLDLLGLDVFTMPTGAAKDVLAAKPDAATLRDRTGEDPQVTFADGVDPIARALDAFWAIPDGFDETVRALADAKEPGDIVDGLAEAGFGGLFPPLSDDEVEQVTRESKIPKASSWESRVASGTASWDGLLTAAALCSFAADQKALDDRIRGLL